MSQYMRYSIGFALSLALTLVPFVVVIERLLSGLGLALLLITTALLQVIVQLIFFLHIGSEPRPHWQKLTFGFMTIIVLIVGLGSIWIMANLDYNMMPSHDVKSYIEDEEAIRADHHAN